MFANPTGVTIPVANGTRKDCAFYKWVSNTTALDCWGWALGFGISNEQLVLWNPSLRQDPETFPSAFNYSCSLAASSSYCIGVAYETSVPTSTAPPSPRASGEAADCTDWFTLVGALTCADILSNTGLTIAQLYAMNPSIKSDCTGMAIGTYYCYVSPSVLANSTSTAPPTTTSSSPPTVTTGADGIPTPLPTQVRIFSIFKTDRIHLMPSPHILHPALSLLEPYTWS